MVRPMMLQGCRKADRAKVVEPHRFATPNSLKSHGERNLFSPLSNPCAITPKLCMPSRPIHPSKNYPALKSRTAAKSSWRPRHRRCPTSRDFVPWRFLDAGRKSAWIVSSSRRPKTSTTPDLPQICLLTHSCLRLSTGHVRYWVESGPRSALSGTFRVLSKPDLDRRACYS